MEEEESYAELSLGHENVLEGQSCITLHIALTKNFFQFQGSFFQQIEGTAMGAAMAPNLANLYVEYFEKAVIYPATNPFSNHLRKWLRYIDDILIIWDGSREEADCFVTWLNQQNRFLKFTGSICDCETHFLDITIFHHNGSLKVKPYNKTTDKNSLLHFNSHHAKHLKNNLPFGQFLRLKRNSSLKDDFARSADVLTNKLLAKGYPPRVIRNASKRAYNNNREALLEKSSRPIKKIGTVFVNTFSNLSYKIKNIVMKTWKKIYRGKEVLPPLVAFRKSQNLRNILIRNDVTEMQIPQVRQTRLWGLPEVKGHFPCGNCSMCGQTKETRLLQILPDVKWVFTEMTNFNTANVVYLITCPCGLHYVGKTNRQCKV
ncbi:uncharacterized protein [Ambystoma mexicanum]|uniref:uncharacterized protein n=1 Tax=Ambystoma mexicanum TaxID=8296 RepID=UPI0037E8E39D